MKPPLPGGFHPIDRILKYENYNSEAEFTDETDKGKTLGE
jgi:hypothetical protein